MLRSLSDIGRRAWLRLSRTQNVGPVTFASLMARYHSASEALGAVPHLAKRGGGAELRIPSDFEMQKEIDNLAKIGGRMIASVEPEYPRGLAALEAPPPIVSILGHVSLLQREMIAIVGARNASALGRKLAGQIATDLGAENLAIASGLARGIDTAAHEASLPSGTCAVVAGGVDIVYPPENNALYERICAEGVIVSEMSLGQAPQARHFPRRNRIISGLSRGVVVWKRPRVPVRSLRQLRTGTESRDFCRARLAARPTRQRYQPADPRGRRSYGRRIGYSRGLAPDPWSFF